MLKANTKGRKREDQVISYIKNIAVRVRYICTMDNM